MLHIAFDGTDDERRNLVAKVKSVPAIRAFGNVDVVGKPDPATYMGSTNIAAVLRAAAILLKVDSGWDWFINLSASDYPLLTQDGMMFLQLNSANLLNFCTNFSYKQLEHQSD